MPSIQARLDAVTEPIVIGDEVFQSISQMQRKYPQFCKTQCLAWNDFAGMCMVAIFQGTHCKRAESTVKKRIADWSKINGDQWWKKKVAESLDKKDIGKESKSYD